MPIFQKFDSHDQILVQYPWMYMYTCTCIVVSHSYPKIINTRFDRDRTGVVLSVMIVAKLRCSFVSQNKVLAVHRQLTDHVLIGCILSSSSILSVLYSASNLDMPLFNFYGSIAII